MLLVIICNRNFKFFERVFSSDDKLNDQVIEKYNTPEIIKKARTLYLDLISRNYHCKKTKDEGNSFSVLIGQAISEKTLIINHISYSFYMYLSRICRLFWEEGIFNGDPNTFIDEPLKIKDFTVKYMIS
jgi:hypothetical protein